MSLNCSNNYGPNTHTHTHTLRYQCNTYRWCHDGNTKVSISDGGAQDPGAYVVVSGPWVRICDASLSNRVVVVVVSCTHFHLQPAQWCSECTLTKGDTHLTIPAHILSFSTLTLLPSPATLTLCLLLLLSARDTIAVSTHSLQRSYRNI